ncbi:MAG: RNA methyltransferase [Leptolyngbyaceae bacterium]|nr:RNA methyltransferase [Leptolyngbyaceae bacterium]
MLTSIRNPVVKQFRLLKQAKERQRQGKILLEGTHLLEEACEANIPFETLCYTAGWRDHHLPLLGKAIAQSQRSELVSDAVVAAIATTVNPDGVVAIAPYQLGAAVPWDTPPTLPFLGVVVDALQDPGNLGTIIRTATAVDVDILWLSQGSVDPTHPKVLRASAGQWFRLAMEISPDLPKTIEQLRTRFQPSPLQVIATSPNTNLSYWDIDYRLPSLILVGNEGAGVSEPVLASADKVVQIPLSPHVESLNAAIATALVLYEAKRQRT